MTYREFKKIVIEYFCQKCNVIKKRYIKKGLTFCILNPYIPVYHAFFKFAEKTYMLTYWNGKWSLDDLETRQLCNYGETINKCCDCLWKIGD